MSHSSAKREKGTFMIAIILGEVFGLFMFKFALGVVFAAAVGVQGSLYGSFNESMLRSELPADSPLLAPRGPVELAAYNPTTAKLFVYFAGVSYCQESTIMDWSCGPCQHITGTKAVAYLYDANLNVAGYVANDNGQAVLAFRGTVPSSLQDWIDDLDFIQTKPLGNCPNCEVHTGFYDSYLSLRAQAVAALNSFNAKSLIVTGHSLGGAMACLAAYDLSTVYDVKTVFTYGQPRVGNDAYYSYYKSIIGEYRVVHYADIVPHLPPESFGFHHVSTEVWYNEDSTSYQVCNGSGEDPKCSDSLPLPISISDHLTYLGLPISGMCK